MKHSLVISERDWNALLTHFTECKDERMAFGYCGSITSEENCQYLVKLVDLPTDNEYRVQGIGIVSLKAENVIPRIARAKGQAAFIDAHVHPFTNRPAPSHTDDEGAKVQFRVLQDFAPNTALIRLIFGNTEVVWAEVTGPDKLQWVAIDEIIILGATCRRVVIPVNAYKIIIRKTNRAEDSRTIAVLGQDVTLATRNLRTAVIGAGGVGSAVLAQLRGYVNNIVVIDPDVVDIHNAPRLYHYANGDEGQAKVTIHEREIKRAFPDTKVQVLQTRFPDEESLALIKQADIIFCCPDHNAVRYAAAQAGARFMKPVIEVGCGGKRVNGKIVALGYHVRLQVPGENCLACNGLDLRELEDQSSTDMKKRIGYINEGDELIEGELMPLTTRAAADAVDIFFRYVNGYVPLVSRHLYFDALRFQSIDVTRAYTSNKECSICGCLENSIKAIGDNPLPEQLLPSPGEGEQYAII